jgi:hypothetical protein
VHPLPHKSLRTGYLYPNFYKEKIICDSILGDLLCKNQCVSAINEHQSQWCIWMAKNISGKYVYSGWRCSIPLILITVRWVNCGGNMQHFPLKCQLEEGKKCFGFSVVNFLTWHICSTLLLMCEIMILICHLVAVISPSVHVPRSPCLKHVRILYHWFFAIVSLETNSRIMSQIRSHSLPSAFFPIRCVTV